MKVIRVSPEFPAMPVHLTELEYLDLAALPPESVGLLLPRIFPQNKDLNLRISFSDWDVQDYTIVYPFLARVNVTRLFIAQCEGPESGNVLSQVCLPYPTYTHWCSTLA
ncbi:hypothetical protein RSAG8_06775, partial [Rhizoctonia solani AG-8 WAC10335]